MFSVHFWHPQQEALQRPVPKQLSQPPVFCELTQPPTSDFLSGISVKIYFIQCSTIVEADTENLYWVNTLITSEI